ncbi:MAG: phage major capsid protein [Sphingomonas sp.]|uniref:phage major capsid protein n=1 Tax=Sphingomonas sp. TaxID=28214 RepID=UPI000DBBC629|nr:phage major capsid protein [Sphingomonas sp.]PZU77755.1 MAG: phage major capsid protein [Sphingomonas sp.]
MAGFDGAMGVPAALLRGSGVVAVRAEGGAPGGAGQTGAEKLMAAFEQFKAKHEARYQAIEEHINAASLREAGRHLNGTTGAGDALPVDRDYSAAFANYARRGAVDAEQQLKAGNATGERAAIQASMSEAGDNAGGYIAPVEWDRRIERAQKVLSPMRSIARIEVTSRGAYSTLWNGDQWGSGWVGETASRPATVTPTLTPLVFPAGEIYANPAVTQRLLDDAAIDFEKWLAESVSDEFSRQEGPAFITGDGINKPMGFLRYAEGGSQANAHPGGPIKVSLSGSATSILLDGLIDLKYSLGAAYRQNAVWLMNSQTAAVITKMKDGDGRFIWRESLSVEQSPTLLGSPVVIDENMPDVAPDAIPVAFGDFARGYLINDRVGVRVLRDPYTNKPYVMFYSTKRVGGGVLDPNAIRLMKVGQP